MSISQAQRARLGIFLIAGTALVIVLFAVPLGFKMRERFKYFYVEFQNESVSGLEEGSDVKFHGKKIGKVSKIEFNPQDINSIKATLRIQEDFPMKADMVAQLGPVGITGLMYLEIMGGTNETKELKPGSKIAVKPGLMSTLSGKAEGIAIKVELLLNQINMLLHPDSSLKKTLDNVQEVTAGATVFMDNLNNRIVADLDDKITTISSSAENTMRTVDSIAGDIKMLTGEVRAGVADGQVTQIVSSIDSTAIAMKQLSENLNLTLTQSRNDIRVSMINLREALENANEITRQLAENPSLLLRGEQQKERAVR
ncbi:MAG: MCE family protein [Chitinivibrionales bacterium]|nr:MCE family protein [Chitinivibrionales bacterium]